MFMTASMKRFTVAVAAAATVGLVAGGEAHAAGLPQLDLTKFPTQIIWLGATFLVLYVVMAKTALPRVTQILEERQFRIDDNLKKAEQLKADAEAAAKAYEDALQDSRAQAQDILKSARDRMADDAAKQTAELTDRLSAEVSEAEARIAKSKEEALADLRGIAVEVVAEAASRLMGEQVSADDAEAAVTAVMGDAK